MNLYFEHSYGGYTLIASNVTKENVITQIQEYVFHLNPDYKIFYIRSWGPDNHITYDVGSHSEFFILTNEVL